MRIYITQMYMLYMKMCHRQLLGTAAPAFPQHQYILNLVIIVRKKKDVIKRDCVIIRKVVAV